MQATIQQETIDRYARAVAASKRVRWSIEEDVIRQRTFDTRHKFLPDGLSKVQDFTFLSEAEKRYLSQIQGRTYANIFGLVERYINAKILDLSRDYYFADQTALEALVRFSDEELKHQELFRRIERLAGEAMPAGYRFIPEPDGVAKAVLSKSTWAVLALTLHIELFTQMHYRQSIEPDENLSPLFKDVFLYHWKEESQHAILDELELVRHDAQITSWERNKAVDEFVDLLWLSTAFFRCSLLKTLDTSPKLRTRIVDGGAGQTRDRHAAGVSMAVHPVGRAASALHQGADEHHHRSPDRAYPVRSSAVGITTETTEEQVKEKNNEH
jgi:hypothetical protein